MHAIFAGILVWVAAVVLRAMVRAIMLLPSVRRLNIVSRRGETVRRVCFRLITMSAVVGWVVALLTGFLVLRPVVEGLKALFAASIRIGNFSVTPADVMIFPLVIWVSFQLSRILCFVLDADVLPRMTLPRGVPGAVTRLTHYTVVVIGVLVAFVAAGFNLDRVTIVFGALGVGIGFGLQNVVPNANLISTELVNWTMQDDRRRIELPVGVAYGTDPEQVLALLVAVAEEHDEVATDPKPQALFLDFGDNSLDFQLRAWAPANGHMRVSSKLRVAITKALNEAGFEIPFPQRDLHLRSIDDAAATAMAPGNKSSSD